ncbi:MAG: M23 family metallopeptidase [Hyphomonadaceae bacterium]|nr:M23 family metallopeptidase [Hyphomonadaceae bacterium]
MIRALIAAAALASCAAASPAPVQETATQAPPAPITIDQPAPLAPAAPIAIPLTPVSGTTDALVAPDLSALPRSPASANPTLACAGAFAQGGLALCRTAPGADILVDGEMRGAANADGWAVIGFDRDAPAEVSVEARWAAGQIRQTYPVAPRDFSIQRVDGLPPQTVNPTEPAVLARIARDRDLKNIGFASREPALGALSGFIWPVEGRISGSWGNQRVLNGEPRTPHYGVDIAVPTGTPIRAPADGVVSLAHADMHFEGGLVFIDHGQGLISMYLHMSRLDVQAGQRVRQGDVIGAVGSSGRTTGPHLCWRLKWRDRNLDPTLAILGVAEGRRVLDVAG